MISESPKGIRYIAVGDESIYDLLQYIKHYDIPEQPVMELIKQHVNEALFYHEFMEPPSEENRDYENLDVMPELLKDLIRSVVNYIVQELRERDFGIEYVRLVAPFKVNPFILLLLINDKR